MSLGLINLLPCIVLIISTLTVRRGVRTWISLIVVGALLFIAISQLRMGVARSCQIDESECVGAKATSYLVLAAWIPLVIALLGRVIAVNRAKC